VEEVVSDVRIGSTYKVVTAISRQPHQSKFLNDRIGYGIIKTIMNYGMMIS
jgi:hypothetical protein